MRSTKTSEGRGPMSWHLSDEQVLGKGRQWRILLMWKENREQEDLKGGQSGGWGVTMTLSLTKLLPVSSEPSSWIGLDLVPGPMLPRHFFGLPSSVPEKILLSQFSKKPPTLITPLSGFPFINLLTLFLDYMFSLLLCSKLSQLSYTVMIVLTATAITLNTHSYSLS